MKLVTVWEIGVQDVEKEPVALTSDVNKDMSGQDGAILLAWDYLLCPKRKISPKGK